MNPTRSFVFLLLVLTMAGCAQKEPEQPEVIRPVRYEAVYQTGGGRTRGFAGVTQAGQEIALSFKVAGTVERVSVALGDQVRAGNTVAILDDRDMRLEVEEAEAGLSRAQAELRNARLQYERIEALFENNNAALGELDQARAAFETAQAAVLSAEKGLALSRRRLDYTKLSAPADGAIASLDIETGENVGVGQTVAVLTAGDSPEVRVDLPGQLIRQIKVGDATEVVLAALGSATFGARVTEVGVTATGGSSVPVTVRLDEASAEVLPGMSAEVRFTFGSDDERERFQVPVTAVGEDMHGRFAFVVRDVQDGVGVAHRVTVETGELTSTGLEVFAGLADGDLLVTAGVNRLNDGTRVKLPQRTEQ